MAMRTTVKLLVSMSILVLVLLPEVLSQAQSPTPTDPGVRPTTVGSDTAGKPFPDTAKGGVLTVDQNAFWKAGQTQFEQFLSVTGTALNPNGNPTAPGLGPRFNAESCVACHAQPAVGGTSPFVNPQVAAATDQNATNTLPTFITSSGPVREARFILNPNLTLDGGVHDLFTITGRSDATGCSITQPDFATAQKNHNVIFRIPTPLFGVGLMEAISESTITANATASANAAESQGLEIDGVPNRSANDGTITRFGWKAQNKSLLMFAGEASNVEMGLTNELFSNERDETPGCIFNPTPEDQTNFDGTAASEPFAPPASNVTSKVENFVFFMRFNEPPTPSTQFATPFCPGPGGVNSPLTSCQNGALQFNNVGCALCHTPSLTTGSNAVAALNNVQANLFSDLVLHHMGPGLADNIFQGQARGDQFRTAPLWGVGQRIFFLHDGRTSDLMQAIQSHFSKSGLIYPASEANAVINNFNALPAQSQQDVLNFLRSL
jgi:CxxC motif-containing protein (DUF1111 family)